MRKFLLVFACVCFAVSAFSQTEPANYRTAVNRFIHFYNQNQPDSIFTMFSADVKTKIPLAQNRALINQLQSSLGNFQQATFLNIDTGVANYKADFAKASLTMRIRLNAGNQFAGLFFANPEMKTGNAGAAPAADPTVAESPYSVKNLMATINGTLAMPREVSGKIPVVLIIAGSGPTDRNGNNPLNVNANTYQMLASALAKNGIASVRYDKRNIGASPSPAVEKTLRFDNYVDDAVSLVNQLHDDPRFSKVIIFGHSEGSLIGMLAANDEPANGFISAAGAGVMADKVVTEQLKTQPDWIQKSFKTVLDTMKKGKTYENVDPTLYSIIRPSVQPYLMSWFRYDPAREIKKLKIPVLILQGTNDLQISTDNADKLKKGKSDAQLVIITGMNHILKQAPLTREGNLATYMDPNLPLDPTLTTSVINFVRKVK